MIPKINHRFGGDKKHTDTLCLLSQIKQKLLAFEVYSDIEPKNTCRKYCSVFGLFVAFYCCPGKC